MNALRRKSIDEAIKLIEQAHDLFLNAIEIIENVCDEEQDAYDNLPQSIQDGEMGEKMQTAIDNLDYAKEADYESLCDEIISYLEDAKE